MLPKYIFLSILRILLKNISKKHVRSVVLFIHTIVEQLHLKNLSGGY